MEVNLANQDFQLLRRAHVNRFPRNIDDHLVTAAWLADITMEDGVKIKTFWNNRNTRVFLLEKTKKPVYGDTLAINRVFWNSYENKSRILISGMLPECVHLLRFPNGSDLHVTYADSGNPIEYRYSEVIAKFMGCKVRRSWIPKMVGMYADVEPIRIFLELECDLMVIREETENAGE